ncbi:hypothetical protein Smp_137690 [Schistosoma mansoni]|uniref:hypothetical protein n=1 Tax=Schistosoma mansoni TaxID=6183 RepID=UPI00022DC3F1|nr:hypothetical protein Smp_137690 [Schistosoma mansoni]|eukprot:XP_018649842.1 hypothetical protein Smp_137690 [Schistosoma mansoni]
MTIENNVDFTGSEKKTANCCIVPDNQKNCSDLANQPQMLHRYPLTPCMGLLHLKYRKVNNCNLSCENDLDVGADKIRPTCVDKTPVVNDYSAKELLKRYPILPYESLLEKEKNKCQDVFKPRRQSLLNRMMPTVRQPIKARHSLHNAKNNNICESGDFVKITGEKNQPIVIRNNSCHEEAKIWNQAKNRLLESKIAQNIPVTSTEYQYSTCKRTKICTVPGMKRRSSIEDAALSRSNEQYLKYDRLEKNGEMIVSDDSCQCVPTVRYVILSRREFDESFGLFVIKSEQGYRITRLSEKLKQNNQLHIGDEIIQINGIHFYQIITAKFIIFL